MNIHKIITLASLAASRKTAAHLLTHILLDAKDGRLTATAFGGDVRVCAWCDYAGKDFTALAPGQRLMDVLKSCKEPTFTVSKNKLTVASNGFEGTMPLLDPEDFPIFETVTGDAIPASGIVEAWEKCGPAVANDKEQRHWFKGMYVGEGLCAATDTAFMHVWRGDFDSNVIISPTLMSIVPADATDAIIGEEIAFKNDWFEVVGPQMIGGSFPDVKKFIPTEFKSVARVDGKEFASAIRAVLSPGVLRVALESDGASMTFKSKSEELGENVATIECTGDAIGFDCNGQNLLDTAKVCEGEIRLNFNSNTSTVIVQCDDDRFTSVIMPLAPLGGSR